MDKLETLEGCFSVLNLSEGATLEEIMEARDQKIEELQEKAEGLRRDGRLEEKKDSIIKEYTEIKAAAKLLTVYRDKFGEDGRLLESDGNIEHLVDTVNPNEIRVLNTPTEYQREQLFGK